MADPPPLTGTGKTVLTDLSDRLTDLEILTAPRCGRGGFGDVVTIRHDTLGLLAIKCLREAGGDLVDTGDRKRARREAEIWQRLKHPNVLPLLGVYESPRQFCFISPFMSNGSLSAYIRLHPEENRIRLVSEVAGALSYLHSIDIVHGDIKAANVLVSDDAHALLCDFGLSKSSTLATSTVMQGMGSIRWMSPELLMIGHGKNVASDIWAFGMMIYETLSGYIPYHDLLTPYQVLRAITMLSVRPTMEPNESPQGESYSVIWGLVSLCWKEEPAERPPIKSIEIELTQKYLSQRTKQTARKTNTSGSPQLVAADSPPELKTSRLLHGTEFWLRMVTRAIYPVPDVLWDSIHDLAETALIIIHILKCIKDEPSEVARLGCRIGYLLQDVCDIADPSRPAASYLANALGILHQNLASFSDRLSALQSQGRFVSGQIYELDDQILKELNRELVEFIKTFGRQCDQTDLLLSLHEGFPEDDTRNPPEGRTAERLINREYSIIPHDLGEEGDDYRIIRNPKVSAPIEISSPRTIAHDGIIRGVHASRDGKLIATATRGMVMIHDLATGFKTRFPLLATENGSIHNVRFSYNEQYIGVATNKCIKVWTIASQQVLISPMFSNIMCLLAFTQDDKFVISGSDDHSVKVWTISGTPGTLYRSLWMPEHETASSVAVSPDGVLIVAGCASGAIRIWDAATGSPLETVSTQDYIISSVAFTGSGSELLSYSVSGVLRTWDLPSVLRMDGATTEGIPRGGVACTGEFRSRGDCIWSVAPAPGLGIVACGCRQTGVRIWDYRTGHSYAALSGVDGWILATHCCAINDREGFIVSGGSDQKLRVWDYKVVQRD